MLQNDGDVVRGLVFVTLYSASLEEQIDKLLFMIGVIETFTDEEQRWPVSPKIKKAKTVALKFDFEGRDDLGKVLDLAKDAIRRTQQNSSWSYIRQFRRA